MLQLSFGHEDLILKLHDFDLLSFELHLLGFDRFIFFLIGIDAIFFGFLVSTHDFIHLLRQFVYLSLQFDVLLYHFLSVVRRISQLTLLDATALHYLLRLLLLLLSLLLLDLGSLHTELLLFGRLPVEVLLVLVVLEL